MLILVPSPLSQTRPAQSLLQADLQWAQLCTTWLVETPKAARAALKTIGVNRPIQELHIHSIKQTQEPELRQLLTQSIKEAPVGLMSDAGCPGIADPGAAVVNLAHQVGCEVFPLVGPNSITLGLMASGLNGQNFHFWGYPPVQEPERSDWIKKRQAESNQQNTTQIVIETPFRNQKLYQAFIKALSPKTLLCVATDLTGHQQRVITQTVGQWNKSQNELPKLPTLFLWQAP